MMSLASGLQDVFGLWSWSRWFWLSKNILKLPTWSSSKTFVIATFLRNPFQGLSLFLLYSMGLWSCARWSWLSKRFLKLPIWSSSKTFVKGTFYRNSFQGLSLFLPYSMMSLASGLHVFGLWSCPIWSWFSTNILKLPTLSTSKTFCFCYFSKNPFQGLSLFMPYSMMSLASGLVPEGPGCPEMLKNLHILTIFKFMIQQIYTIVN